MKVVSAFFSLVLMSGCLFIPSIEEAGYNSCESEKDCGVGRQCTAGYCTPPPWNDESYERRRLLVLENETVSELPEAGALVFWVGASGMTLKLDEVPSDTRYTYYHADENTWKTVPVFLDTFDDRYAVWVPLSASLASGARAPLVWMESKSGDAEGEATISPIDVFDAFYNFGAGEACVAPWLCFVTGAPVPDNASIRVADNQMMVLSEGLTLPFDVSFKLRVNGSSCENVFWGLKGGKNQSFDPPMLGFNVGTDRDMSFEVYPRSDSLAPEITDLAQMDTVLRTYRIHAGTTSIRIYRDQDLLAAIPLETLLEEEGTYYPYLDVDGDCSIEIRNFWATSTPVGSVKITPESPVDFQLF